MQTEIAICLTSHNRIDCARINQEIIKLNYRNPLPIVHATSSPVYERYLEDGLVVCEQKPLHEGAINLLQSSIRLAANVVPRARYFVHLESDTWLMDEGLLADYVARMDAQDALLATCGWTHPKGSRVNAILSNVFGTRPVPRRVPVPDDEISDFGTQFFIVRNTDEALQTVLGMVARPNVTAEDLFFESFTRKHSISRLLRMTEREPVSPSNRYWCNAQHLYCQHWPARGTALDPRPPWNEFYVRPDLDGKRESLLKYPAISKGEHLNKLLDATDLSYYNPGALRY